MANGYSNHPWTSKMFTDRDESPIFCCRLAAPSTMLLRERHFVEPRVSPPPVHSSNGQRSPKKSALFGVPDGETGAIHRSAARHPLTSPVRKLCSCQGSESPKRRGL